MSDVNALIDRLAGDIRPVRRLKPAWLRALFWLACVAALAAAVSCFADLRGMARRLAAAPDMWLAMAGSSVTCVLAAVAAFQTSVPGRKRAWALLPAPGLLLWMGASGWGCLRTWVAPETHVAELGEARECLIAILLYSIPLSALLVLMLRRAYALRPNLTAALGGLAAASAAATLLEFTHPFDAAATDLTVHAVAIVLVILANRMLSGPLLGAR